MKVSFAITPNVDEAKFFSGVDISTTTDMKKAAHILHKMGCQNVIIKGGHLPGMPVDLLYDGSKFVFHEKERLEGVRFHGLGCRFSAALTAYLAQGHEMGEAFFLAQKLISQLLPSLMQNSPPI